MNHLSFLWALPQENLMQLNFKITQNNVLHLFDQEKYLDLFWNNLEVRFFKGRIWVCSDVFPLQVFQWEMKDLHMLLGVFVIAFADCFVLRLWSLDKMVNKIPDREAVNL